MMKFSVATPVFNGMPALRRCIGSVRGQLLPPADVNCGKWNVRSEQPFAPRLQVHHIIQDGGSSDGTVEFLKKLDAEVRSPQSEVNADLRSLTSDLCPAYTFSYSSERDAGMYDAINKAWAKAVEIDDAERSQAIALLSDLRPPISDTILSWLNADEQYLPGALEKVQACFEAHPDIEVVFGNMIIVDPNGRPLAARREIPFRPFYVKRDFLYTASCTLFFRRTLFDRGLLKFDTAYRLAGDMDLILKLAQSGVKFCHLDSYLSLFGADNNNLSVKHKERMEAEVQCIRRIYGGSNSLWNCKTAKLVRFAERALCGCYRQDNVSFLYANNEKPEYRQIDENGLGFRFTYELAQKKLEQHDS